MVQVYLPVVPRLGLTSKERAYAINRELFNLELPRHLQDELNVSTLLVAMIEHPTTGDYALQVSDDLTIKVHRERDLSALVSLFPQLTQEERDALIFYIATNDTVTFANLIPSDATTLTYSEAEAAGWFPTFPPT